MVSGRDVIVQAEAGMGKTSTIAIAILQNIDTDLLEVQALVLSPTRELATQTQSVITALGDYSNVECHAFVGGTPIREDIKKLDNNSVHVISGTAGRVLDMMKRKKLRTQNIKMLLVEEADEMLNKGFRQKVDKGFREQIEETYRHLPPVAQVVFLGITLPESVLEVTATLMRDPIRILFKRDELTLEGIKQYFVAVKNENQKFDSIISLFDTLKLDCALVLCNSKRKVAPLAEKLRSAKFTVSCMCSQMPQVELDQNAADFRAGNTTVLITTAGRVRGIDMPEISHVINFDLSRDREHYFHPIGHLGLLPGCETVVINFVTSHQVKTVRDIERHYSTQIDELNIKAAEVVEVW